MQGREILVGVTGSVAAYKTAELVSRCVQAGAGVSVILTRSAVRFIGVATFEALTGRPVYVDMFEPREHFFGEHIGLARRAEVYCIAPATAHTIARLAHGFGDDLLCACALVFEGPVLVAPAMNVAMWRKPAVQRNVQRLRDDGFEVLDPEPGWLSCREEGTGRMADVERIFSAIQKALSRTAHGSPD